jgi:predicted ATPase/DNA-binding XRE family transcriptional regulator
MPEERTPFGPWVRALRVTAGLTQAELAESSGISERTVSDLERGLRTSVYPATARQLAAALQVPTDTLPAFLLAARGREAAPPQNVERPASSIRSRLPTPLTRLIGREPELGFILGLLRNREIRLVTVVGPGGVGKTRLATEAAVITQNEFNGGAFFVNLAAIDNPRAVLPALAGHLGIGADHDDIMSLLATRLERGRALLVLDTFEHLLGAARAIRDLLTVCTGLTVLATSRSPLNVRGERLLPLQPLAVRIDAGGGAQPAAVELFLERALATSPLLAQDSDTVAVAADICLRLDGLPLAVELAAARVKHMPLADLAKHLDHRLQTLIGGAPESPPRHQTMRSTLDWSYALLDGAQQQLFRSLAVFRGGFSLDAAISVATDGADGGRRVIDTLSGLVDASLIVVEESPSGKGRYRLLDVVREYALEEALDAGELDALRRRYAAYFVAIAQEAEPKLRGNTQREWHTRLLEDESNFRAALTWALDDGQGETALRLAGALWMFWRWAGLFAEGRAWLEAALAAADTAPSNERLQALWGAGWLAYHQGDYKRTDELGQRMIELLPIGDDGLQRRNALTLIGNAALAVGKLDEAVAALNEALTICERSGNGWALATSLLNLGTATLRQERAGEANALFERALSLYEAIGDRHFVARTLIQLGYAALERGDRANASGRIATAMQMAAKLGDMWSIAEGLEAVACERAERAPDTTATLAGAALRVRERIAMNAHPADQIINRRHLDHARSRLGSGRFAAAWDKGRELELDAAIGMALSASGDPPPESQAL